MKLIELRRLDSFQKESVRKLWNEEYPKSLVLKTAKDLDDYLDKLVDQNHILLLNDARIIGWFFGFIREKERWFAIIVSSKKHKKGYGTLLLEKAKSLYAELNGWVITEESTYAKQDGSDYNSPLGFYLKSGFSVLENEFLETDKTKAVKIKFP